MFSERITEMADQIYTVAELTQTLLEAQLKDQFLEGVKDEHVAKRLIWLRPATLDAAVYIALREQQTTKALKLRRNEARGGRRY